MVTKKPGHQGEHVISRKTIVQGMPGRIRCTCGEYSCAFYLCTRGYGCSGHPAFPAPSLEGRPAPSSLRDSVQAATRAHRVAGMHAYACCLKFESEMKKFVIPGRASSARAFDVQLHIKARATHAPE